MRLARLPTYVLTATRRMLDAIARHRLVLLATTGVELRKRYAGSALGASWLVFHPLLLLAVYLFVFLVVFKVRFPGYSEIGYVLYVFAGLVPYLGLAEAVATGSLSIKQNVHLVKNVMLPIELIPVRAVAIGLAGQLVGLGLVIALAAAIGELSPRIFALPLVLALQFLLVLGIVLVIAAFAVFMQDVAYFVNIALILLMFLSPIGFKPDMLPSGWQILLWVNPLHYLIDAFRFVLLDSHAADPRALMGLAVLSLCAFGLGSALFMRLRPALVDYE